MADPYDDEAENEDDGRRSGPRLPARVRAVVRETSRESAQEVARQAAREAINETFMSFGIDLSDDRSRREFFEDMIYVKNMRIRGKRIGMLIVGAVVAAVTGLISTFVPSWLHR